MEKKGVMTMVVRSALRVHPCVPLPGAVLRVGRLVFGGASTLMRAFIATHTHQLGQALKSVARLVSNVPLLKSLITTTNGGAVSMMKTPTDARLLIGQQGCVARPNATCTWTRLRCLAQVADEVFQAAALLEVMSLAMAGAGCDS